MTLIVAHRGASAAVPPGNTIAAFLEAVAEGADWVELDARMTADGQVIVHHDPKLGDGRVISKILSADLPPWVPTLSESLVACAPLAVNVEIKPDGPPEFLSDLIHGVTETLLSLSGSQEFLVTSFDHDICDRVRKLAPSLSTGLLSAERATLLADLDRAVGGGHVAINPWYGTVTKAFVDSAHSLGISVNVWTVDEPPSIRLMADFGVDAIITNSPRQCRNVLVAGANEL
ncbi:MAG: glycerophosphodiester phosphodiesterase [Acidimicrobiales bacterium]